MIDETPGNALRRFRHARGLSLRGLNALVHVDVGHLSKIENGERRLTPDLAKVLDAALGANGELVSIVATDRVERVRAAVPFESMKRRTLVNWGLATAGVVGVSSTGLDRVGRIGLADVQQLQHAAVRLYGLDYQHGGESLWRAAVVQAREGSVLLDKGIYGARVEAALLRTNGRLLMCAGWLAFDAGEQDVARTCYTEALALAKQAKDREVETHALANLAFQSSVLGRPRAALRFADAAGQAARSPDAPARLGAIPSIREAIASALAKDASRADAAITSARRVLDRDGDKPTEEWCAFLSAAEMDGIVKGQDEVLSDGLRFSLWADSRNPCWWPGDLLVGG